MTDRPLTCTATEVRALLAGTKTQVRRVLRIQPREITCPSLHGWAWTCRGDDYVYETEEGLVHAINTRPELCSWGKASDRLWCRETFANRAPLQAGAPALIVYRADEPHGREWNGDPLRWRPSIHMPRWASRLSLEVVSVRVERLQSISEADARAEGIQEFRYGAEYGERYTSRGYGVERLALGCMPGTAVGAYRKLWDRTHAKHPERCWDTSPWGWVLGVRRVERQS